MTSEGPSLLSKDSVCGRTLLNIVGHGNSIIAEIQRLGPHIPPEYYLSSRTRNVDLYRHLLPDFVYQRQRSVIDERIQQSVILLDLDETFKSNFLPTITRFFILFRNVFLYSQEIHKFLLDLKEGVVFVDQNLEKLLGDKIGKQLLCEMCYLLGVELLLLDIFIPGEIRERLLMSYFRYKTVSEIDQGEFIQICNLCQRTEILVGRRRRKRWVRPREYPVTYFARVNSGGGTGSGPFPGGDEFIEMIVSKLRMDDIYNTTSYYPYHQDRTTALSNQAGLIYIMLYFRPDILRGQGASMRQIVDQFFHDCWLCSFYMGFVVDIRVQWDRFPAARQAMENVCTVAAARSLTMKFSRAELPRCREALGRLLTEGVLTQEYVLDHVDEQIKVLRSCNVCLRWLLLHRSAERQEIRQVVHELTNPEHILLLLLDMAQYEYLLKTMFEDMLKVKEDNWESTKGEAKRRMKELSSYFSGTERLAQGAKDEQLEKWFLYIEKQIESVNFDDYVKAGNKLHEIITALRDVEEFKNVYSSLQVKQYLDETRVLLRKLIRYVNIQYEVLQTISILSDISYGWKIIDDYIPLMQRKIVENPSLIVKLRSTFLKLSSMMEVPCVRIKDAGLPDFESVSSYYSKELVKFVRRTLEIIPRSMFRKLSEVIGIHTNTLNQLPTKFNRDELRDVAQLEIRDQLARCTYEVSEFTDGVLAMNRTLFGIVEVDPRQLLEDGVRKELVRQISDALETHLVFPRTLSKRDPPIRGMNGLPVVPGTVDAFEAKLHSLSITLNGMCRSFEYIQDYILVYGLKLWHEEYSRIIHYNVEMECNRSLKNKVQDCQSRYQSSVIPIPVYNSGDEVTNNFMGRLVRELLVQSDPNHVTYLEKRGGWYHLETGKENLSTRHFFTLEKSVGIQGMRGIDIILSFGVVRRLAHFQKTFEAQFCRNERVLQLIVGFRDSITPLSSFPQDALRSYATVLQKLQRAFALLGDVIMKIGRYLLLRRHIQYWLSFSCKLHANLLFKSLDTLNTAILSEIDEARRTNSRQKYPGLDNPLIAELDSYLEQTGLSNPFERVYVTHAPLQNFGIVMALYIISQAPRLSYDRINDTYVKARRKDGIDGFPMIAGLVSIMRQAHIEEKSLMFRTWGQMVRTGVVQGETSKFMLRMVRWFAKLDRMKRSDWQSYFPPFWYSTLD